MKIIFFSTSAVTSGSRIAAKWGKNEWWSGTVKSATPKKVVVTYDDGATEDLDPKEEGLVFMEIGDKKKRREEMTTKEVRDLNAKHRAAEKAKAKDEEVIKPPHRAAGRVTAKERSKQLMERRIAMTKRNSLKERRLKA